MSMAMDRLALFPPHAATFAKAAFLVVAFVALRTARLVLSIRAERRRSSSSSRSSTPDAAAGPFPSPAPSGVETVKTLAVLGSGGHTAEMMRLLAELDPCRYAPIVYAVAETDATSVPRLRDHVRKEERRDAGGGRGAGAWRGRFPVEEREGERAADGGGFGRVEAATVRRLPRAREVHQSYASSAFATLRSFLAAIVLLWDVRPDLVLANGPGTCVPVIYAAFLLRILGGRECRVVFVESFCRVRTLSLSGRLVYPFADRFVVHWPQLKEGRPLVEVCEVFVPSGGS
ncbi:hypothetical protein ACHAWF_003972 [Thalassiosira exigua]